MRSQEGPRMSFFDKSIDAMVERAPHWFAIVAVTGIYAWGAVTISDKFTTYLEHREEREAEQRAEHLTLADLRIETCHAVQERATDALERVIEALAAQERAFGELTQAVEDLNR